MNRNIVFKLQVKETKKKNRNIVFKPQLFLMSLSGKQLGLSGPIS